MHSQENDSLNSSGRDPYSVLILLFCSVIAVVLAVAGVFSFLDSSGSEDRKATKDISERVRDGELPDHLIRMAYDEVKRLSNTPVEEKLYWNPDAKKINGGLLVSGVVQVPNGSMKEFFVKFGGKDKKIVDSEIRK